MTRRRTCALVLGFGVLVATTSAVQPEPTCETWNTAEFFSAAPVEAVAACLDSGADPMAREAYSGRTPLHMAAMASTSPEVIELLLAAGAQVNARSRSGGETPLEAALRSEARRDAAVIEALLAAGADPNETDINDWTPLHQAASMGEEDLIKALIRYGADLDARNGGGTLHLFGGNTPLHVAVGGGAEPAAVAALLAAGSDVNARTEIDASPLHMVTLSTVIQNSPTCGHRKFPTPWLKTTMR